MRNLLYITIFILAYHQPLALAQDDESEEVMSMEEEGAEEEGPSEALAESESREKLTADQTLTIRILKATESKKTVLINRGSTDGLDMGMHARLFNDGGTVARAILVDIKDDRSIWSVYRQVSPDLIESDQVMTLKITPEVKITNDETKSVLREGLNENLLPDLNTPASIPLDQVQGDLPTELTASGVAESDLRNFQAQNIDISAKKTEIFMKGFFLAQQAEVASSSGASFSGNNYAASAMLGVERYFNKESYLKRFSLSPFLHFGSQKLLSYEGAQTDTQFYEVGIGGSFYFIDTPHTAETLHPHLYVAGSTGIVNDEFSSGQRDTNQDASTVSKVSGNTFALAVGLGLKYFTPRGFAFTFSADVVRRLDQFDADPDTDSALWDRVVTGPRLSLGMGARF
jgi:hypothetical protein